MQFINISIISHKPKFILAIMGDCINCMKEFFENHAYKVVVTENTFVEDAINIIWGVGTHYSKDYSAYLLMARKYNTIFINMEQLGSESTLIDIDYLKLISQFKVIDYNMANLNFLRDHYDNKLSAEFPFAPALLPKQNTLESQFTAYDYAFYGAMNSRREYIINALIGKGIKIKIINGKYGEELSNELSQCKALLNIHYYQTSIFEIARCLRPVADNIPILSEASNMPVSVDWREAGITFYDYNSIESKAQEFLENDNLKTLKKISKEFITKPLDTQSISTILNLMNFAN